MGDGNRKKESLTHLKYKYFYLSGKTKRKNTFSEGIKSCGN